MNMPYDGLRAQEFADLCGVSKDTLLYYDNIGLFRPELVAENGYRVYSLDQVHAFDLLLLLRDSHLPLKEIRKYLHGSSPEQRLELLKQQSTALQMETERLQRLCKRLDLTVAKMEYGMKPGSKEPEIQKRPGDWYVLVPVTEETLHDRKARMKAVRKFLQDCRARDLQGNYLRCAIISGERLRKGCYEKEFFGVCTVGTVNTDLPGIFLHRQPSGLYAVLRHQGGYDSLRFSYERLMDYIRKQGWQVCGNAYETELMGYIGEREGRDYVIEIAVAVRR